MVPKSKEWLIVFDHEEDISFNGKKEFVETAKEFFDDWGQLSEFPERRKFGKSD